MVEGKPNPSSCASPAKFPRPQTLHPLALLPSNPAGLVPAGQDGRQAWGFWMPSTLRRIDGDAPIAPDIVPADWADCVPVKPTNDAISREKLFAEIRHAAEAAAPKVDNTFRATDVNGIPALDS